MNANASVDSATSATMRAIEPVIGHMKSDHRLDRCFLHGRIGDVWNVIGSAAGFNIRKLLRLLGKGIFSHAPETLSMPPRILCRFWTALVKLLQPIAGILPTQNHPLTSRQPQYDVFLTLRTYLPRHQSDLFLFSHGL